MFVNDLMIGMICHSKEKKNKIRYNISIINEKKYCRSYLYYCRIICVKNVGGSLAKFSFNCIYVFFTFYKKKMRVGEDFNS